MRYQHCKTFARTAFAAAMLCGAATAHAFVVAIDQFVVTKNGNAFFTDSFNDGVAPPSAPNFIPNNAPANYIVFGSSGSENAITGRFTMDSSLGQYQPAGDGTARNRNLYRLQTDISASTTAGLKSNHTFSVSGLFDLLAPPDARDQYGIDLQDATGPAPNNPTNGQVWSLSVGRVGDGTLGVHLIRQDYTAGTVNVMATVALDTSHEQISLSFVRDNTANNLAHASFQYYDGGIASGASIAVGDASLFQYQQWVRAEFFTGEETPVIPAPASALLLLAGLGLLGFSRRRGKL